MQALDQIEHFNNSYFLITTSWRNFDLQLAHKNILEALLKVSPRARLVKPMTVIVP
jgi:hypothetical protein